MRHFLVFLVLYAAAISALAQHHVETRGNVSPILIGAKNKVDYIEKIETQNNIPLSLAPYIAGLIFSNKNIKSDSAKNISGGMQVWMNKYFELKRKIQDAPDSNQRNLCLNYLSQGDFASVENTLKVSTDFHDLKKWFPSTYQTNGSKSPIIVGDYGTVTYIVQQIITYSLPEGLTVTLLNDLKLTQDSLKLRSHQLQTRKAEIRQNIANYRAVVQQLQASPNTVNKRVLAFFKKQEYDSALNELDRARGSDSAVANNELMKARILMLQLNFKAFDSTVSEINKAYNIAVTLEPSYAVLVEYGRFLDKYNLPDDGARILSQALNKATTLQQKVVVSTHLSDCLIGSDMVKARQIIENALQLLHDNEPIRDSLSIVEKGVLQFYMGRIYSLQQFDTANYLKAIDLSKKGIATFDQLAPLSTELKYYQAIIAREIGSYYTTLQDYPKAIEYFKQSVAFFENPEAANLNYFSAYVLSNLGLANAYSQTFQIDKSDTILLNTIAMIQSNVNLKSRVYVQEIEQTYTALIVNMAKMSKNDDVLKYTNEFRDLINPFYGPNAEPYYSLALAEVDADLGAYYLQKGNFPLSKQMLEYSYNYYVRNLSDALKDRLKFVNVVYTYNEYYVTLSRVDSGIAFNENLLVKILENKGTNPQVFSDLESQIYYQISDLYFDQNNWDSADLHIRKAIEICEPKAKLAPLDYAKTYAFQINGLCRILLRKKNPAAVDSLASAFIASCNAMAAAPLFTRSRYHYVVGALLSTLGWVIQVDMDSLSITDPVLARRYLADQDDIMAEADRYFQIALQQPNLEASWNYANFLYVRASEQYRWESFCPKPEIPAYHKKRDDLLSKALTTANTLPPTPTLDGFRQMVATLSQKPSR